MKLYILKMNINVKYFVIVLKNNSWGLKLLHNILWVLLYKITFSKYVDKFKILPFYSMKLFTLFYDNLILTKNEISNNNNIK